MASIETTRIEVLLSNHFDYRTNLVVPNVSWGLHALGHEADLIVVRPSGYCIEVEIKISRDDLKSDALKPHHHHSKIVRELWFACPEKLTTDPALFPPEAGVLALRSHSGKSGFYVITLRRPKVNLQARKLKPEEINKLMALGCMRIWSLKTKLLAIKDHKHAKPKA